MDAIRRLNTFNLKGYPSSLKNECIHYWSDSTKLYYSLSDNFSQYLFVHASQVWIGNVESEHCLASMQYCYDQNSYWAAEKYSYSGMLIFFNTMI